MRIFPLFVGLAVALALPIAPPASAGHGSDSCNLDTNSDIYSCTFVCHKGDQIHVRAYQTGPYDVAQYPRISASCGGVSIWCQQQSGCEATSTSQVESTSVGSCIAETVWMAGECRSLATFDSQVWGSAEYAASEAQAQANNAQQNVNNVTSTRNFGTSAGPYATEEQPSRSVDTPYVAKFCTLGEIVCVGPVQSVHVTNTPELGPVVLVPHSGFHVSFTDPQVTTPTIQTTPTGPHQVTGEPVPIVVCGSTCQVPSGVSGGVTTSLTITIFVGDVSHTETLP